MIKRTLIRGFKVTIPLIITLMLVYWAFATIESFFGVLIKPFIPSRYYFTGLGAIIGIIIIFFMGLLINAWMIRILYKKMENLIDKIPFIKTIYQSMRDFLDIFDKKKHEMGKPVIIEWEQFKVLGFVTNEVSQDLMNDQWSEEQVVVYIPMSYQIGGFTVILPSRLLTPVNMNVQDTMKFILTAGIASSNRKKVKKQQCD